MPERPKGAVCKIAGEAYGGSNPPPPTDVMSRDIVPRSGPSHPLIALRRVQVERPDQLPVFVHDAHVEPSSVSLSTRSPLCYPGPSAVAGTLPRWERDRTRQVQSRLWRVW